MEAVVGIVAFLSLAIVQVRVHGQLEGAMCGELEARAGEAFGSLEQAYQEGQRGRRRAHCSS